MGSTAILRVTGSSEVSVGVIFCEQAAKRKLKMMIIKIKLCGYR
jgi:hypothetical protein